MREIIGCQGSILGAEQDYPAKSPHQYKPGMRRLVVRM
jgi:hypothetical protein